MSCSQAGTAPRDGTVVHLTDFLYRLILEATRFAPFLPIPYNMPEVGEISITGDGSKLEDACSRDESMDSPSFEISGDENDSADA